MPAALVAKLAETTDIDIAEAEKRWNRAKAITTEEKGLTDKDGEDFWKYVTGVFKRSMGIGAVMEAADPRPLVERSRVRECPTSYGTCPTCGSSNVYGTRGMTSDRGCSDCHACWHYLDGEQVMGQTSDLYRVFWKDAEGRAWVFESATAEEIHAAAHEAATSHLNDLPQPTQAQLEAGNYAKGHLSLQGLQIAIENPKGSTRRGVDRSGKAWQSTMQHHYGYIKGTIGKDKDHLDVFIGEHPESEFVFVVDQVDPDTRRFDEHKIMLGFTNTKEARAAYLANYEAGWKGLAATTGMTMAMFKIWLKEMDTTKPMQDSVLESAGDWRTMLLAADSFDGIRAAFTLKWPELGFRTSTRIKPEEMNPETFAFIEAEIRRVSAEFPELPPWVKQIVTKKGGLAEYDVWDRAIMVDSYISKLTPEVIDKQYPNGPKFVAGGFRATIVHEIGHALHHAMRGEGKSDEDKEIQYNELRALAKELGAPSAYAEKSTSEWLAERFTDEDLNGAEPVLKAFIKKVLRGEPAINRLTNNQDGAIGQVSNTTEGDTMIEKNEKDGFTKAGQSTAYYIEQLKALGCPEELLQVARDLTAKKKPINENNASEDGVQQETVKWDGSEFYYLSKGEWGFNRIQIMPSNGYVDFGQGFTPPPEKVTPPTPAVPKNPKTGPQRVAVLRSMAADIPGMQDYLDKMDAVTTKKEMRQLDDQKYLLIPSLRGSEIKIGELSLYWIMADLRDQKEREINKRLKEEAQAAKTTKEREKTEQKEREDLQLKRYKERPELKKVLDLISADFRVEIVEGVTKRYTRMVEQYFTAERPRTLNLLRPDPRKTSEWEWASYQRTMGDLKPFMVQTSADEPPVLRSTWKAILDKLANDTADYWIAQFENKTAWKLGDVLEKKGGGDVSLAGNVHEHAIRMAFPDGSGFTMRTQQVYAVSTKGTPFARYPTTFHNVVFPDGERMSTPSAAKMQKEFGIADDKDAATGE